MGSRVDVLAYINGDNRLPLSLDESVALRGADDGIVNVPIFTETSIAMLAGWPC